MAAFTLDQPVHKIRRSRKTMVGFITTMLVCQALIQAFVYPFMGEASEQWLKTTICSLIATWALLAVVVQALGPGHVKRD